MEEWRPVVGFPTHEVSNQGRVRSVTRWIPCSLAKSGAALRNSRLAKPSPRVIDGRLERMVVQLAGNGVTKVFGVHRLVLEAFVGPCPDGLEGCHYDGDAANNRLSNLRWDTPKANQADAIRHGRKRTCENHPKTKLTPNVVRYIRGLPQPWARGTLADLASRYGISASTVTAVRDGRSWYRLPQERTPVEWTL